MRPDQDQGSIRTPGLRMLLGSRRALKDLRRNPELVTAPAGRSRFDDAERCVLGDLGEVPVAVQDRQLESDGYRCDQSINL